MVCKKKPGSETKQNRRNRLEKKHPLPAGQASALIPIQAPPGNRATNYAGDGPGGHEQRDNSGSRAGREPRAQVKNYPGKETSYGSPEKKPQRIERSHGVNGKHAAGSNATADHQKRNPSARADALQRQICRHLKQKIAEKENSRAEAVNRVAEAELCLHLQRGKAHIDAVEIRDHIQEKQKRKQAPAKFLQQRRHIDGTFCRERKMFKNFVGDLIGRQLSGKCKG